MPADQRRRILQAQRRTGGGRADAGAPEGTGDETLTTSPTVPGSKATGRCLSAADETPTRCGFVAVVGGPNVGKSTLVNRLVGAKVSIVSPKAQTTRFRIVGIAVHGTTQVLFVDTPGLFPPRRTFDRALVAAAWRGMADADAILLVVDSRKGADPAARDVLAWLAARGRQAILVLNKIDLVAKPELLRLTAELARSGAAAATFMVSARSGDGTADLLDHVARVLPLGPWLFAADDVSDLPDVRLAAEITREQVYWQLHEELPYAIAVETTDWRDLADGSVRIEQTIFVERSGQRAIVLGRRGERIRQIGERARLELERLLGRRAHLFLQVRERKAWRSDRAFLARQRMDVD